MNSAPQMPAREPGQNEEKEIKLKEAQDRLFASIEQDAKTIINHQEKGTGPSTWNRELLGALERDVIGNPQISPEQKEKIGEFSREMSNAVEMALVSSQDLEDFQQKLNLGRWESLRDDVVKMVSEKVSHEKYFELKSAKE